MGAQPPAPTQTHQQIATPSMNSLIPKQNQPKKQAYEASLIQLRIITEQVLKQFQFFGEGVKQFQQQMTNINNIRRGQNFQGRVNQKGEIIGIGRYYRFSRSQCLMFFGQYNKKGYPTGKGIQIRAYIMSKLDQKKQIKLDQQQYQAYLTQQWNQTSSEGQKGSMIKKVYNKIFFFKGKFKNGQFNQGRMSVKQDDAIKMHYQGNFIHNTIEGTGNLQIPNKYRYSGQFHNQKKQGFGEQLDLVRKTYYIGQFKNDKRDGYGEITYLDRQNVKLKGFWVEGVIENGQGMYIKSNGMFLESIGEQLLLL